MWTQIMYAVIAIATVFVFVIGPLMVSCWRMWRDPWAFLRQDPKPWKRRGDE